MENPVKALLKGSSFLLVLIIILILLYAQTFSPSPLFPQDTAKWNTYFTGYLIFFALTLIGMIIYAPDIIKSLTTANYWKAFFFNFLPVAVISIIFFIVIQGITKGPNSIDIRQAVNYMPISILIFHAFIVAQIEELLFGGLIYKGVYKAVLSQGEKKADQYANVGSAVTFSLWHYAKAGGSIPVLIIYIPLRFGFNYVRNNGIPYLGKLYPTLFGPTRQTQQANAGAHFAWNTFVIGFLGKA